MSRPIRPPLPTFAALGLALLLTACGTTPRATLHTLDNGTPASRQGNGPSVLLLNASLPELLDRPQLVLRSADQHIILSERQRWAEPLRSGIPRIVAADLGHLLDSTRVAALPNGAPYFDADYRLVLHVQHLEARLGQGIDLDLLWTVQPRQGKEILGRSQLHENVRTGQETATDDTAASELVAAQRRAFGRAAAEIAAAIRRQSPTAKSQ